MGEFFKGWRRKAGLVTLAMACVLMVAWIRSMGYQDAVIIFGEKRCLMIASANGSASWVAEEPSWVAEEPSEETPSFNRPTWRWINRPITSDNGNEIHATHVLGTPRFIQYAPIVLPLTLLSAWLILIKPRKAKGSP